ncbi:T9SS type A sorting domain-containing protein [Flavobacterium sp.]|uniref:T9SS type A sorting domain-containing protein n=1 Tax=Flavobacterium sp. TaxID=239 RepID=UPI00352796B9
MRILFYILIGSIASAQNLVPNPSFEVYTQCPNSQTQINYVSQWNRPPNTTGTPDYFNSCAVGTVDTPSNIYGTQEPFDGNGYVGICTYYQTPTTSNFREYIQTQLISPLVNGETYQVSFYVSLSENPGLASNNIGAIFTVNQLTGNGSNLPIVVLPQILHQDIVLDTTGWTQISGTYTATGNEQYLTIGNFFDNAQTQTQITGGTWGSTQAIYYIDNVSVTPFLKQEDFVQNKIKIFPNPVTDSFSINAIENETITNIELYSGYNLVKRFSINDTIFDIKELPTGIYYLSVTFESNNKIMSKIIKL